MPTPVAVLSGGTRGFELGVFKNGSVAQGFNFPLSSNYRWWNGIDVLATQYLIYTDKYTMGSSNLADTIPVAWATPDLTDQSLINLINTLPPRVGLPSFTSLQPALDWLQGTNDFYLVKNGLENIVTTNLQLYWDSGWYNSYIGSGTLVNDLTTNNFDGTLLNSVGFNSSGVAAFSFDGTDDAITGGDVCEVTTGSFSIEVWVKINVLGTFQVIVQKGNPGVGSNPGYRIRLSDVGIIEFVITSVSGQETPINSSSALVSGEWYLVHCSRNGTNMKIYVDGVLSTNGSGTSGSLDSGSSQFYVGRQDGGNWPLNGMVSSVKFYDTQLTPQQVLQNYNTQKGRFGIYSQVTNGQALKLDASNPASYPGSGTEWYDISGFANNAELLNGPTFSSDGGGSISFDGTDDRARIPQTNSLYGNTFTWEFWIKFDSFPNTYSGIVWAEGVTGGGSGLQYLFSLQDNSGTRLFHYRISNTVTGWANTDTSTINFTPTDWAHIVWTFDNGTTKIYTQGSLFHINSTRGSYNGGTDSPIFIGGRNDSFGSLDGKYGLTNYYNRALSVSEIVQNFESKRNQFSVTGVVTNNLIFWLDAGNYASYNGSGTTWYDISGNVMDTVLYNGISYSTIGGGSLSFDGADDYSFGPITGPVAISGDISVAAWVKDNGSDSSSRGILGKMKAIGGYVGYGITKQNNNYKFWTAPTSTYYVQTDSSVTDGLWHYIVGVRSGSTNRIYLDGVLQSGSITSTFSDSGEPLTIGRYYSDVDGFYWNSLIGNCQIYNRTLSGAEVLQNFNAQKNRYGL
jgi:hypothetical protein